MKDAQPNGAARFKLRERRDPSRYVTIAFIVTVVTWGGITLFVKFKQAL